MSIDKIDKKKFGGKYVATANFSNNKVIASGKNFTQVYQKAIEKGIKEPVVNFIHKEGSIYLY